MDELEERYKLLKLASNDRMVVCCKNSLISGLYLAGRAKRDGLNVTVHIFVEPGAEIKTDVEAINYSTAKMPDEAQTIIDGIAHITFSSDDVMTYKAKNIFNKAYIEAEEPANLLPMISKMNQMMTGEKLLLLDLPFQLLRKINISRKQLFGEKKETVSLRQLLKGLGFQVSYYDVIGKRLLCSANIKNFDERVHVSLVPQDEFGKMIAKELIEYIIYLKPDAGLAIESSDKEYLYYVQGEKRKDEPLQCDFVCLDGQTSWRGDETRANSRKFSVIVLPNTERFRGEFEQKGILILSKEKAFELYGEEVEPF